MHANARLEVVCESGSSMSATTFAIDYIAYVTSSSHPINSHHCALIIWLVIYQGETLVDECQMLEVSQRGCVVSILEDI